MAVFALLSLAACLSVATQDPQAAGMQALDRENYQQAEQIFSQLAAADPKNYAAVFNLALAETALKKDEQAAEHYKQVLTLKPGLYQTELNLGMLYLRDHRPGDALPLLRDASKQKPDQARPKRYLGDSLLAAGDLAGAADAYRDALAIDPKLAAAELGLGQSLQSQGKLDDALPHYRKASELDPNLQSFLLEMAIAFSKANRPSDAIATLRDFPNDAGAREELGRLYLAGNQPADAVLQFQAAAEMSPTPANRLALATAYLKNNQPNLAAPILEQALAANPNDYDLRMAIARIHRDRHDYVAAGNQFVAAANLKPDSVEAWNEAASAFVIAQLYPEALAALERVHNLNAETAGDFYYRAIVLDKMHQVKSALKNYQQFLQLSDGKFPDQEFVARQRSKILEREANR
ncbi:MAG: tetratricopeptide repeat protein [Bryobacteraceae bacterium]